MSSCRNGSCVLVILTIMSMLLLIGMATYKSGIFFQQFAAQRVIHEQAAVLTRSLLEYGIAMASHNYDDLIKNPDSWQIRVAAADCQGMIKGHKIDHAIVLQAQVNHSSVMTNPLSCIIGRNPEGAIYVRGFQKA